MVPDGFGRRIPVVFPKVSKSFFDENLHFQKDWTFFSERVRNSDFFRKFRQSAKFMGKLTDFENFVSARRNLDFTKIPFTIPGTVLVHLSRHSLKSTLKRFSEVRKVHLSRHSQPAAGAENFEVFWYFRSWVELITYEDFAPKVVLIIMIFFCSSDRWHLAF